MTEAESLDRKSVIGRKIKAVRTMTKAEAEGVRDADDNPWTDYRPVQVLVLDDGTRIFAASDDELACPGMFGLLKK